MAKTKVPVYGTVGRALLIDADATNGAQLGANLYMPDGSLATAAKMQTWLGVSMSSNTGSSTSSSSSGITHHSQLQGLTTGNDHPQYARKAATETIAAAWTFAAVQRFDALAKFYASIQLNGSVIQLLDDGTNTVCYDDTKDGVVVLGANGGQLRYGTSSSSVALEWYADASVRLHGALRVASDDRGDSTDVLQSTGSDTPPVWVPSGPRYLTQTAHEKYWTADNFVRGQNVIGVRFSGAAFVYLPHDLPIEHLIAVKDETGTGPVTIRVY